MLRKPRIENLERREVFSANPMLLPIDAPPASTADMHSVELINASIAGVTTPRETATGAFSAAVTRPIDKSTPIGLGHNVVSPRDAASGLPTGKRVNTLEANTVDQAIASQFVLDIGTTELLVDQIARDRVNGLIDWRNVLISS